MLSDLAQLDEVMAHLIFTCFLGLATLLAFALSNHVRARRRENADGCRPLPHYRHKEPFFGNDLVVHTLVDVVNNRNLLSLNDRFQVYGSTFQTTNFAGSTIFSKDPKQIQHVYTVKDEDWGLAPFRLESMAPFCGFGFITTDGAPWEHSRSLMRPHFHKSKLSDLSFLSSSTDRFLRKIPKDGSTVDLQPLLYLLLLDNASQFVLGERVGALSGQRLKRAPLGASAFLDQFQNSLQGLVLRIIIGRYRKLLPESRWRASLMAVHRYFEHFIEKAFNDKQQHPDSDRQISRNSILAGLLELTNDRIEIRNHLIQAMMAGQDTMAVLIANALFLLSRTPGEWTVLREEAISLAASGISFNSLLSSQVLRNILNGALRLYPVFALLGRTALRDTTLPIGGGPFRDAPVFVPGGTDIQFSFYSLHRDPSVYGEDVEAFRPSRWNSIKPRTWEYTVFGQGPRSCLGQQKALVEASFVLVKIALAFKEIHSRDDEPWMAAERLTTRNAHGCKVALLPL